MDSVAVASKENNESNVADTDTDTDADDIEAEAKADANKKMIRRQQHLWATIGLCGSSFSMFYLIMNVFPYSGFMALRLLNGKSTSEINDSSYSNDNDNYNDNYSANTNTNIEQTDYYYSTAATIGPYAGILASSFRLGRIPTAIAWGRCADVYGRKFTLIVGIVAMIAGNILFGLASSSFATAVAIRFGTGLMNGTMVVVRTAVSEIAGGDSKLESRGVAMVMSMSGYGMLIGPAIGGLLSDPIKQYPNYFRIDDDNHDSGSGSGSAIRLFGKSVLEEHPFLLPNLIGSIVAFVSLLIVITCVEETLPEDQLRDWRWIPTDLGSWSASRMYACVCMFRNKIQIRRQQPIQIPHYEIRQSPIPNEGPAGASSSLNNGPMAAIVTTRTTTRTNAVTRVDESTPLVPPKDNPVALSPARKGLIANALRGVENGSYTSKSVSENVSVFATFLDTRTNVRYFFYSMWSFAFTSLASLEAFPLFAMASTAKGGLGLDETGIGLVQAIAGCIFVTGQYTAFSFAKNKFGLWKALRICALGRSLLLLFIPLGLYFVPSNHDSACMSNTNNASNFNNSNCLHENENENKNNWFQLGYLGLVVGVISILGSIFMGCATIGVNACIERPSQRASMNGLQSMIASIGRGLGPIFSGYLVASTMTSGAISANASAWAVYGVLMVMETITYFSTRFIPDGSRDHNNSTCDRTNANKDGENNI